MNGRINAARRRRCYQGRLHDVGERLSARGQLDRAMTEDELQQGLTDALTYCGWRWHHVRRADWAQQMGHAGFPDIVAARDGRILFLELKTESGRIDPEQTRWLAEVQLEGGEDRVQACVVRPSTYDATLELIR